MLNPEYIYELDECVEVDAFDRWKDGVRIRGKIDEKTWSKIR